MILDLEKYHITSPGSAQRILCKCDDCGKESLVIKQSLVRRRNSHLTTTFCQRCAAIRYGKARKGIRFSEEHHRRTREASIARNAAAVLVALNTGKDRSGPLSPCWNPDRAYVRRAQMARRMSYKLLDNTLKRVGKKKNSRTEEALGYTKMELYNHIESLFVDGMSWDNRSKWHIDHIKPVAKFVKEGITDVKTINALENLRPLWARDNLARRFS